ncbi:MAG TPA: DUF6064 family protein [Bacteroidota bacterium]
MNLPFTQEQFLSVFEHYNHAVWPAQIILNLLGLGAVVLAVKRLDSSNRIIAGILATLWVWIGLAYHLAFFASINPAANIFALFNVLQGMLFLVLGVVRPRLSFGFRSDIYGYVGALFVVYAMILYPALGYTLGHVYPKAPTFGLPCPTTIFTFGLLLWTDMKLPRIVLVIPLLWSIVGFTAATTLGIREDIGLLVAGVLGTGLILFRDARARKTEVGISNAG